MQRKCRIIRRRYQRRREYAGRAVEPDGFDAAREQRAKVFGEPKLVDEIGRAAIGPRVAEQASCVARRVDLLVIELSPDRANERAEWRCQRQELDFASGLLRVVLERGLDAVDAVFADADFVMVIFDRAGPEADHVDGRAFRPKLAFAGVLDLIDGDAGVRRRAVHGWDVVERAEAGDRGAHIAAGEEVGAADRLSFRMER